ncbi:MAG: HEPN domain-containing protein [Candidatus Micrarchaeota archaeon]|nr:HEPN domain-containing protein [Candidatus Micrarchaeota archaeon]
MGKTRELVKRAIADFELARRYRDAKESFTASLLYKRATEKVLRALFIKRNHHEPPKRASIVYMAKKVDLPVYITETLDEQEERMEEMEEAVAPEIEETRPVATMRKRDAVKRLIDYAVATVKF